jgi:hypothetical protein
MERFGYECLRAPDNIWFGLAVWRRRWTSRLAEMIDTAERWAYGVHDVHAVKYSAWVRYERFRTRISRRVTRSHAG